MRVRRRKELGLVTLVLHHAEGDTDTWQRGGRAASMAKMLWRMAATPSLRGQIVEHVAGASVPVLEADFGPVLFIFGPRALNQTC
jgi:hypothetical protein